MNPKQIVKKRPAETKTGALGGGAILVVSILEGLGIQVSGAWLKVIAGGVTLAPAFFTWLFDHGGIRGVIRRFVRGNEMQGTRPTADVPA